MRSTFGKIDELDREALNHQLRFLFLQQQENAEIPYCPN